MHKEQQGLCAICNKSKKLYQDHNHEFGFPRELLCDDCNNFIARAKEDVLILEKAIQYIHKWEV